MGIDMEQVKFTTSSVSHDDVRWYRRQRKNRYPFVLYVNGNLKAESDNVGDMERLYQKLAAL